MIKRIKIGRLRIGSITQKLLLKIGKIIEEGIEILDLSTTPFPDFYKKVYFGPPYRFSSFFKKNTRNAYNYLKKKAYIKEEMESDNKKIIITSKGRVEIFRSKILEEKRKIWDGKWRIIIFDISEEERRGRNLIRGELKWLGFLKLQKSVWICPYNIENELKDLIEILRRKLKGDIRFLTVEKMNYDNDFRRLFRLK